MISAKDCIKRYKRTLNDLVHDLELAVAEHDQIVEGLQGENSLLSDQVRKLSEQLREKDKTIQQLSEKLQNKNTKERAVLTQLDALRETIEAPKPRNAAT